MSKSRLETFSDGVIAIVITIMVLELTVPAGASWGLVLLLAAVAYFVLQQRLVAVNGLDSRLGAAIGRDLKGKLSPVLYLIAIAAALLGARWLAYAVYIGVALIWVVPDRRIERTLAD